MLDRDGRIVLFNHACEELNDIRADDVCGRKVSELLSMGNFDHDATTPEAERQRMIDTMAAALAERVLTALPGS